VVLKLWLELRQEEGGPEGGPEGGRPEGGPEGGPAGGPKGACRQLYHQQASDVCMLRLFTAFMESAPQLVFQLYALIQLHQPAADADADAAGRLNNASWAAVSAAASTLSLAWGVAAYCRAVRVGRERRRGAVAAWVSSLVEGVWRFCLLAARIMALVLLCLALQRWALLIFCKYSNSVKFLDRVRRTNYFSIFVKAMENLLFFIEDMPIF
jgi:hypothetical protein